MARIGLFCPLELLFRRRLSGVGVLVAHCAKVEVVPSLSWGVLNASTFLERDFRLHMLARLELLFA